MAQSTVQNIFLVGPMGAGKTTIGRQLADLLRWEFVDSDHEIEARTGADIPWIFDIEGEAGFRLREEQVIDALTQRRHIVLATGGGAVTREQNRRHLHDRGTVIYLETPVERQLERTARDHNRPLLRTPDPRARLTELLSQRDPLYREVAHHIMPTERGSAREVAWHILQALGMR
ncbi:shikimate kinase AroK [Amnimonas aquatica]|uniref:Shikimate kinase n=1 Tax=Amnimonas aquatica TaxID=2094561 RepID=A0A2P6AR25_9GAMM|nr:shikimate kinase AroK [Amnimonas aquatica]PQA34703.1 shikimate kinase AroK [Amnimonas aquatica]